MFLATTAIDSFWDVNKKIVFLGPWCRIPRNEHIWKSLDYEIMPSPWRDREVYYKAGKYTYKTYHYLLGLLTDYLNEIHGTKHSKRFWQIIIGPWLLHFTEAFYDRYYCLKIAIERYPQLETILLDETSYVTPYSMKDFFSSYCDDFHSLQYYSQILRQLGVDGLSKKQTKDKATLQHKSWKYYVRRYLFKTTKFIASKKQVVLWDVYLSYRYLIKYIIISKFASFPILREDDYITYLKINDDKRRNFSLLPSQDEFTKIIISSLAINFPTLYLEGFDDFLEKSLLHFKNAPKVIISAIGWYTDERLKFLAAYWAEKGTVLCGLQHGGLYGTSKWMPPENHEIEITDRYYTWGWNRKDNKYIKSLPNPKISTLMDKRKTKYDNRGYFLFVGTNLPRYLYRFFSCPVGEMFDEYLEWRNRFLKTLTHDNRNNTLLRLYPIDYERGQRERILNEFREINIDDNKVAFLDRLEKSKIVIIDYPVTTMLESLARNRPTILFWNPCYWELREEAKPFFNELAKAKMWYKDPKSAADFLNKISANPLEWWNDASTQSARNTFVNRFAHGSKNWAKIWWAEMQEILKQH